MLLVCGIAVLCCLRYYHTVYMLAICAANSRSVAATSVSNYAAVLAIICHVHCSLYAVKGLSYICAFHAPPCLQVLLLF